MIAYPPQLWSLRPCALCGASVRCEPGFPDVRIICWSCIREGSR